MEKTNKKSSKNSVLAGVVCLVVIIVFFAYLGVSMGTANMLNTVMKTAHDLLINTVFYLMSICVLMGALSRLFAEFGVVSLLEKILRPLMKPLFNLPGVASLGAVMTFLSDNPAIISLSKDKRFSRYFKKYQLISLTNFGTAFGMGLIVIVFMMGQGFFKESLIGLFGSFCGCIVSTRLMQRFTSRLIHSILRRMRARMSRMLRKRRRSSRRSPCSPGCLTAFWTADVPESMSVCPSFRESFSSRPS